MCRMPSERSTRGGSPRNGEVYAVWRDGVGRFVAGAWWDICWNSGFRGPLAQLTPADVQQFKEEHVREVEALRGRDGIFFDGTTFVAKGQVDK